tara:strand:+ start:242 stop:811 length:570 start_codon:yes stop_codon:yes gene_type:complete
MNGSNSENLVWLDMEMSGLDVDSDSILEIATIVTDGNLNLIEEGPNLVINQEESVLALMDEWNKKHHGASGLIDKVRKSTLSLAKAERQTLDFISKYCPKKTSPLCGNSIGQDRKFLYKNMRTLHDYLHYRNIDVSSLKELIARWYPYGPELPAKSGEHIALVDVRESIAELKFYRKHYFITAQSRHSD